MINLAINILLKKYLFFLQKKAEGRISLRLLDYHLTIIS
ncbi:hypothetical protein LA14_0727 [Lactobacillus acidophilus La-14]|nr:hypothetical protein LA14_0727 [Lactobacillus acidophilus La-14]